MCPCQQSYADPIQYTNLQVSKVENHLIVPDHLGGVLAKTSENACVGDLATKFVSATAVRNPRFENAL